MSTVEVREVSEVDAGLRAALLHCWTDVINAGGAVGFVAPVTEDDVEPSLDELLDGVRTRGDVLVVLSVDGEPAGFAALVVAATPLKRHWASVLRVQVHPSRQRTGLGRVLMTGVHDAARAHGWEFTHLTVRGGTGREAFYQRLGYEIVGLMPRALRLGPDDYRDEFALVRRV